MLELLNLHPKVSKREKHLLLAHILQVTPSDLYLMEDYEVPFNEVERYISMLSRLEEGYPLQYLLGEWEFYGRTFKVEEGVLIPRPETELLVEKILTTVNKDRPLKGFEIGVGTGCISVTLLLEIPSLVMYADDVNPKALQLAYQNACMHQVQDRLYLMEGSLFEPVRGMRFHLVVSNPPYIPEGMWDSLPTTVKWEGKTSLIGGPKGYEFYEKIASEIHHFLEEDGMFFLEIGHDQGSVVRDIFEEKGFRVEVFKDLAGQDRVVVGWM